MNKLQKKINYTFKDISILKQALTHSSINSKKNYQRLEFLGDSIITHFITDWLYNKFTLDNEGQLSIKRAQLINKNYLSKISKSLHLDKYLFIEKNIIISDKIYTDILESLIGAIYLDSNYKTVSKFLNNFIINNFINFNNHVDYKGALNRYRQKKLIPQLIINTSKNFSKNIFITTIKLNEDNHFYGFGRNKIEAEQRASKLAYEYIKTTSP